MKKVQKVWNGYFRKWKSRRKKRKGKRTECVFDAETEGYKLRPKRSSLFSRKEVFVISKILLTSRALMEDEMFSLISKIWGLCSEEVGLASEVFCNEMYHYTELQHGKYLLDTLWQLEQAVRRQNYIVIRYRKRKNQKLVESKIKPVGIFLSEYYFYLAAFSDDTEKNKASCTEKNFFPEIYRVDKLEKIQVLEQCFSALYAEGFEEGAFQKRILFRPEGEFRKVRIKCSAEWLEDVLDRLPTAEIQQEDEHGCIITAEVIGDEIELWVKSIGEGVELLE